jgi:dihydrofolate reductase
MTDFCISLVAAIAENGVIGADGALAWKISDDLKWFKKVTMGKPVVMGRKTFASIGAPLPGRDNIVLTRSDDFSAPGVLAAHDVEGALSMARDCAVARDAGEICVIGGGEIYAAFLPRARRIYLTRVAARVAGDAYFPDIDPDDWIQTACGACDKNARNDFPCAFFILDRRGWESAESP